MTKFCLVATSGDMSKHGMGDKNTVYVFKNKHKKYVDRFLKAQLEYHLQCYSLQSGRELKYYLNFNKSFNVLKDIGIFTSKYDARTSWDLSELSEVIEGREYKPILIGDNYEQI